MKCPECGYENAATVKFCAGCGVRVPDSPTSIVRPAGGAEGGDYGDNGQALSVRSEPRRESETDSSGPARVEGGLAVSASQYDIIGEIGSGGIGTVYLARDKQLGRFVALKRLGRTYADNPCMTERLLREARSIAALSHAGIVQVFAIGKDAQGPFIVMEYVPGPNGPGDGERPNPPFTLHEKVAEGGPLSHGETVQMMLRLCDAMAYAHRRGIIHRDLKPANILISESGLERIVDFGLARKADADEPRLTRVGTQLVSLGYGAPEQEQDAGRADARADVYALGAIMFFSLTGENPRFFRENRVPSHLLPPLLKALAKGPAERWQTAKEFEQALRAAEPSVKVSKAAATESGMWRCEWCHTSNPLEARYCSECGWDGQRLCPECGAETRVGVRFCPGCGADIKQFEDVRRLLSTIHENVARKDYHLVLSQADSVRGFHARRQAGHEMLEQIRRAKEKAESALARMNELAERIEQAVSVGNYELVAQCVAEYDSLSDDDRFSALKEELPGKVRRWRISNELAQAKKMLGVRNWEGAERSCRKILRELDDSDAETRAVLRRILLRKRLLCLASAAHRETAHSNPQRAQDERDSGDIELAWRRTG